MRVLHALHTSLPFLCGYSIRSHYILRFQQEQGLDPAAVTSAQHPNGGDLEEMLDGIPHWRTPAPRGRPLPLLREIGLMRRLERRLGAAIAAWGPEVIHAHSPMLVGLPAARAARRAGLPFVYEVRDLWENASVDRGKFREGSARYRLSRRLETNVLRQADAVVVICRNLRAAITPRVGRPDKVWVVENGVDMAAFAEPPPADAARRTWRVEGRRVLAYVGTFQPYEGLDLLLAALPEIRQREPRAHLVITGSGGVEAQLRELVARGGLARSVTFTGRLPHERIAEIYALADVMVYPRVLTRVTALTTPLKPLEAMAMGKAVLASDVPAMLELVRAGHTGQTFRAGNASDLAAHCLALLRADGERARLGAGAREWVRRERQWPQLIRQYAGIYRAAGQASPVVLQPAPARKAA